MRLLTDNHSNLLRSARRTRPARWAVWVTLAPLATVLAACDRSTQVQKTHTAPAPEGAPIPAQVAVNPPTAPTTRPDTAPAPDAPADALASYLYFQYPTDASGQSSDPVTGSPVDLAAHPWGVARQFPPARLRLHGKGDEGVSAMLFSDDPKEAINKNYTGDSYYFLVKLPQVAGVQQIDGARFWFQTSPHDREDSPNGIFLRGDRYRLEPTNAIIHFEGTPPHATVHVRGHFLQADNSNPKIPAVPVFVQGVLVPRVEAKD